MAAPKSKLNIGGSEAYVKRRKDKASRHFNRNGMWARAKEMHEANELDEDIAAEKKRRKKKVRKGAVGDMLSGHYKG